MSAEGSHPDRVIVEADGGSRGNPGPAGYGAVVRDGATGRVLAERNDYLGVATNNVAEYRGLIAGLTAALELGARVVAVRMDSKLVVEQMSGRWQVKHPAMKPLALEANDLRRQFDEITFAWIPREQNKHADRLANEAMDRGEGRPSAARAVPAAPALPSEPAAPAAPAWVPPDTRPTRLVLVRHGSTEHSAEKRFSGRNELALDAVGQAQAAALAERLARLRGLTAVVASPLRRATETAQVIAASAGLEVETNEDLIETDFGVWEGQTFAEAQASHPAELAQWLGSPDTAPPGGESFAAVARRVRRARDAIIAAHPGKTVVVVSHVTPIKTLVRLALDAPPVAMFRIQLDTASVSTIDYYADGNCSVRLVNDTSHLRSVLVP